MQKINVDNLILQGALSAELNQKVVEWRKVKDELKKIGEEYESMAANEFMFENENYRKQIDKLEIDFEQKRIEFVSRGVSLRLLFSPMIFLN